MKKIYSLALGLFLLSGLLSAQCTIDSTDGNFGFNPRSRAWPRITAGKPYSYTIGVFEPSGTTEPPITFVNLVIDTIMGLPQGITYSRNPASDTVLGGGYQCILLSGTTNAVPGLYPLTVLGTVLANSGGTDTLLTIQQLDGILAEIPSGYTSGFTDTLTVLQATGISDLDAETSLTIFPNPGTGKFKCGINVRNENSLDLNVLDIAGQVVYNQLIPAGYYNADIDLGACAKGIYTLLVRTPEGAVTKKIVLE